MFSISSCPHCGQQVLISMELSAECQVRCLICEAEFPLSQALVNAVDAPPELVPVASAESHPEDGGSLAAALVPRTGSVAAGPTAAAGPTVVAGLPTEPHLDVGGSQPTDLERAAESDAGGPRDIYALAGSRGADKWPEAQPNAVPAVSPTEAAALWRSRQKPVSSLGSVGKAVAIVAGGFLGVAVAYLVLSIVSPSRFDFLHLWGHSKQGSTGVPASGSKGSGSAGEVPGQFTP
jgi:hypothetical protein